MALTARFDANFDSFVAAVQKAELSLKKFEQGAGQVETALNRMGNSLSGVKIVQSATLAASAVEKLGGVSTLTDKELQRVGATAQEAAEKLTRLGQEVPPGIQRLADAAKAAADASSKAGAETSSFADKLKAAIPTAQSLSGSVQSMALGFATGLLSVQAFKAGFTALIGFISSSITEWQKQETAYTKLGAALTSAGLAAPSVRQQMISLGEAFAKTTIYSDDMLQEMEALLVQVGHVMPDQMRQALTAATDLSAGLGIELREATLLVGKAFAGETGTLTRYGIVLDQSKIAAQGASYVLDQLHEKFGGQAAAAVDTLAGRTAQAGKAWDEFKESVGQAISPVLSIAIHSMTTAVEALGAAIHTSTGADNLAQIIAMRRALGLSTETTQQLGDATLKTGAQMQLERIEANLVREALAKGTQSAQDAAIWQGVLAGKSLDLSAAFRDKMTPEAKAALVATLALTGAHSALAPALQASAIRMLDGGIAAGELFAKLKDAKLVTDEDKGAIDRFAEAHQKATEAEKKHSQALAEWSSFVADATNRAFSTFIGKFGEATIMIPAHIVALNADRQATKQLNDEVYAAVVAMSGLPITTEEITKALIAGRAATQDDATAIGVLVDHMRNLSKEMDKFISPIGTVLRILPQYKLSLDATTVASMAATAAQTHLSPALLENVRSLVQSTGSLDKAIAKLKEYNAITAEQEAAIRAQYKEMLTLTDVLDLAGKAFAQMGQIGGATFGPIAKEAGQVITGIQGISKASDAISKSLDSIGKVGGAAFASAALAAGELFSVLVGIAQQMAADANAAAQVANQLRVLSVIQQDFGSVSEETGKKIQANFSLLQNYALLHKDLALLAEFPKALTNEFIKSAAEALSLSDVIKDLGGVSAASLGHIETSIGVLLKLAKLDGPVAQQALTQLNTVIQQMGDYFQHTGGIWDAVFQAEIKQAKDLGQNLQAINDLIAGQQGNLEKAIGGVTGQIGNQAKKYSELVTAVKDAQKAYDDLVASGASQDEIAAAADKLTQAQERVKGAAKTTQEEFDRLSRIALASFNTLVASGKSPIEAMNAIGGSIDDLIANANAFGLSGNAAFAELSRWRGLTKDNADLLTSISSLNDVMVATANLGGLTADGFKDLETQGLSAYQQLIAAGFSQQEAEAAEKPLLESIIKLHNERGLAIDDETQKLIDQSIKDGVITGQQITTNQILLGIAQVLSKAFGIDLPESLRTFADAGIDAAKKVGGAISDIPTDLTVNVDWNVSPVDLNVNSSNSQQPISASRGGLITAAMARQFAAGGIVSPSAIQYLASGGHVSPFAGGPQGTDTVPAWLTPGERVLSVTQNKAFETLVKAVPSASSGMVFAAGGPVDRPPVWHLVAGGPVSSAAHSDAPSAWSIPALSHGGPIEPAMVRYLAIGGPVASAERPVASQPLVAAGMPFATGGVAVPKAAADWVRGTDTVRYLSGGGAPTAAAAARYWSTGAPVHALAILPSSAGAATIAAQRFVTGGSVDRSAPAAATALIGASPATVRALALGGLISVPGRDTYGSPVVPPSAAGFAAGGDVTPERVHYLSVGAPVQPALVQAVQAFSGGGVPTSVSEPHASSLVQYFSSGAAVSVPTMPGAVSPVMPQYFSAGAVVPPIMPAVQWFSGGGVPTPMMQAFRAASGADVRPVPYLAAGGAVSLPNYLASGDVAESWIGSAVAPGAPPPLLASASSRPASDRPSTIINVDARGALFPDRASIRDLATLIVKQLPNAATIFVNR